MTPLFILPSNYQLVVLGGGEYIQIDLEEPVRVASTTRINSPGGTRQGGQHNQDKPGGTHQGGQPNQDKPGGTRQGGQPNQDKPGGTNFFWLPSTTRINSFLCLSVFLSVSKG